MKKLILICMTILTIGLSLTGCGKSEQEKQAEKFFDEELTSTDEGHAF